MHKPRHIRFGPVKPVHTGTGWKQRSETREREVNIPGAGEVRATDRRGESGLFSTTSLLVEADLEIYEAVILVIVQSSGISDTRHMYVMYRLPAQLSLSARPRPPLDGTLNHSNREFP